MDINLMNGNFCSAEQYRRALEEVEKEKKTAKNRRRKKNIKIKFADCRTIAIIG